MLYPLQVIIMFTKRWITKADFNFT